MQMYAMLWWATHDKNQIPDELEIWYAGAGKRKQIPVPEIQHLDSMYLDLQKMWTQIKGTEISIADCPPNPKPLRKFLKGGVDDGEDTMVDVMFGMEYALSKRRQR